MVGPVWHLLNQFKLNILRSKQFGSIGTLLNQVRLAKNDLSVFRKL